MNSYSNQNNKCILEFMSWGEGASQYSLDVGYSPLFADTNSGVKRPVGKFSVLARTKQGQHIVLQTNCTVLNVPWGQIPFSAELPLVYIHLLLLYALLKQSPFTSVFLFLNPKPAEWSLDDRRMMHWPVMMTTALTKL